MTVFTTQCWPRPEHVLASLLLGVLVFGGLPAQAADKTVVERAAIRATAKGPLLDAKIVVALSKPIADALSRGITQPFVVELEIERPRKWWIDADVVETEYRVRLIYHLLLRRYIVEAPASTHSYATLDEALSALGTLDGWALPDDARFAPGQRYRARLRLRIDTEALPKPLIIGTFTSDRWALASPWFDWSFEGAVPDKSVPDKSAPDKSGSDKAAADKALADKPAADKPATP